MGKRHLEFFFEPPFPVSAHLNETSKSDISLGDTYFLVMDGLRIGPFLCMEPIEHLEMLLHSRGIRIAI